jgi:hypothetical protein
MACLPPPPPPPQELIDACTGLATGATCSFSWKGFTVTGACRLLPDGTTEVCAPLCGRD